MGAFIGRFGATYTNVDPPVDRMLGVGLSKTKMGLGHKTGPIFRLN